MDSRVFNDTNNKWYLKKCKINIDIIEVNVNIDIKNKINS